MERIKQIYCRGGTDTLATLFLFLFSQPVAQILVSSRQRKKPIHTAWGRIRRQGQGLKTSGGCWQPSPLCAPGPGPGQNSGPGLGSQASLASQEHESGLLTTHSVPDLQKVRNLIKLTCIIILYVYFTRTRRRIRVVTRPCFVSLNRLGQTLAEVFRVTLWRWWRLLVRAGTYWQIFRDPPPRLWWARSHARTRETKSTFLFFTNWDSLWGEHFTHCVATTVTPPYGLCRDEI